MAAATPRGWAQAMRPCRVRTVLARASSYEALCGSVGEWRQPVA